MIIRYLLKSCKYLKRYLLKTSKYLFFLSNKINNLQHYKLYSISNTTFYLLTYLKIHTHSYKLIQLPTSSSSYFLVPLYHYKLLALCMALQSLSMFNTLYYSLWFTVQRVYGLDTNASEWLRHIPLCTVVKVKLSNNQILRFK